MATMMRSSAGANGTPSKWQDSQVETKIWSANGETDRNRDRDGDYTSGSSGCGGGRYHELDERYGSHRRESGSQKYGRSTDKWQRV